MTLQRIRLELARTKEFPNGSAEHGYELVAPLDTAGILDPKGWKAMHQLCTVRRFWGNAPDEHGLLIHRQDGRWVFSYQAGDADDEPVFRLDRHRFAVGEYISVTEHDGVTRPFRITSVEKPVALRHAEPARP
jgi:hypothetical protein